MADDPLQGIEQRTEPEQRAMMIQAIRLLSAKFDRQTQAIWGLAGSIIVAVLVFLITTNLGGHH